MNCQVSGCGELSTADFNAGGADPEAGLAVCEAHEGVVKLTLAAIRAGETIRYPAPGTDGYRFLRIRAIASDPKPETVEFGSFSGAERIQFPLPMPHDPETTDWASWLC